jgi:AcrR family transcriptional regulator
MATTTETRKRAAGRPRVYSDETIFSAVDEVLRSEGYTALTLEAIALRVGCTRQALVRRYGSKRALLLASLDGMASNITSDFERARDSWGTPLAALHARLTLPPLSRTELASDPRTQAHSLANILTASSDPAFGDRFARLRAIALAEIRRLLDAAVDAGELQPVDTTTLARTLHGVWTGETINWCADQSAPYATTLSAIFEQIVGPYREPAGAS